MYDAWGKIPSGVLSGNHYELGDYDACLQVQHRNDDAAAVGTVHGQYCLAQVYPRQDARLSDVPSPFAAVMRTLSNYSSSQNIRSFEDPVKLKGMDARMLARTMLAMTNSNGGGAPTLSLLVALCVPTVCSARMVGTVFDTLAKRLHLPVAASVTEPLCSSRVRQWLDEDGELLEADSAPSFSALDWVAM